SHLSGVRSWAIEFNHNKSDSIPDAVSELAHQFVLDFGSVQAFRTARSFMDYTRGLRQHLFFNQLHGRGEFGEEARKWYELAIKEEGQNPHASYAIAQILYSSYQYDR